MSSSPMYMHAHSGGGESHRHGCGRAADSSVFSGIDNSTDSCDRHCHLVFLGFELGSIPVPAGSILSQQDPVALGSCWSPGDSAIRDAAFGLLAEFPWSATLLGELIDLSPRSLDLVISIPFRLCDCARHDRSGVLLV